MNHLEEQTCDLIQLDAIIIDTIKEAIQYLNERYDEEMELVHHAYLILNKILEENN